MAVSRFIRLNNGARMPSLGLGTYLVTGSPCKEIVDRALSLGYHMVDTAAIYGNENDVGEVLQDRINSGYLKRKDVFVTTKVPSRMLGDGLIKLCAEESLERLKLTYVDMFLIHMPYALKNYGDGLQYPDPALGTGDHLHQDLGVMWQEMEDVVKLRKSKAIGLSNTSAPQVERMMKNSTIPPANLQFECHAYCQQRKLRKFCQENDIVVTAFSPLGARGRPERHVEEGDPDVMADPAVNEVAKETGKSPGQVLLRFLLQLGMVVLPKTTNFERLSENLDIYNFTLSAKHMRSLHDINKDHKFFRFRWAEGHPEYASYEVEPF